MAVSRMRTVGARGDRLLIYLLISAAVVGSFAVLDAGYARAMAAGEGLLSAEWKRHLLWLGVFVVVFQITSRAPVRVLRVLSVVFYLGAFLGAILVFVPGVGVAAGGAQRWIGIGPITLQPGELLKTATILFLACVTSIDLPAVNRYRRDLAARLDRSLTPFCVRVLPWVLVLLSLVLVEREPDLGTAAMIGAGAYGVLLLGRARWPLLVGLLIAALAIGAVFATSRDYRMERIATHASRWDPSVVKGPGLQAAQSEVAMAFGGASGVGIGQGRAKHVLPAATTDFVFTTIAEEFGLIGSGLVILLLGGISIRLIMLSMRLKDRFSRVVVGGIGWWIGLQSILNLLMAGAAIPPVGIPLPFISYGGSSLLALAIGLGAAQAALKMESHTEEKIAPDSHRRRHRRTRLSRA